MKHSTLATRENLQKGSPPPSSGAASCFSQAAATPDSAAAWRRALVVNHDRGNRRGMTNVLSCVTGLADRTGRSETRRFSSRACAPLGTSSDFRGSANERYAEQRIEEHLRERKGTEGATLSARRLDVEATIDLALDTLNEIAADASA